MTDSTQVQPRAGIDYPSTFRTFQERFATEEACLQYLSQLRWPEPRNDVELLCLVVAQHLLGIASERKWI